MSDPLTADGESTRAILQYAADLGAEFLTGLRDRPVCGLEGREVSTPHGPGNTLSGVGAIEALRIFWEEYVSGLNASAGPRYFGFVTGGSTPASVGADWLVSCLDQSVQLSGDSSAASIERCTIDLLKDALGLPIEEFCGAFVTGATMANFVGLAIGREWLGRQRGVNVSEDGVGCLGPVRVISAAAHSSIAKVACMLGMGRRCLVEVACLDDSECIDVGALEALLTETPTIPTIVVLNAGTVNTTAFDDIGSVLALRTKFDFWLHVDAAFGGAVGASSVHRWRLKGWEAADSITVDAHKWLNVPYDSAIQLVATAHLPLQMDVFKNTSPYLGKPEVRPDNYLHLSPENSRRFRALPVWMNLKAYGREGLGSIVDRNVTLAALLSSKIEGAKESFRLLAPTTLNVVCFALADVTSSEARDKFIRLLNEAGKVRCTPTTYRGIPGVRAALSNWMTTEKDIFIAFDSMVECRSKI